MHVRTLETILASFVAGYWTVNGATALSTFMFESEETAGVMSEQAAAGVPEGAVPQPDVRLRGGERIGSLEVVPSPGHTPGHMAFLDTRERWLFAGDTFTSYWRTEIPNRFLQPFPLAAFGTHDREEIVVSAAALADLEPCALALGHGPVVREPQEAMRAAIRRAGGSPVGPAQLGDSA